MENKSPERNKGHSETTTVVFELGSNFTEIAKLIFKQDKTLGKILQTIANTERKINIMSEKVDEIGTKTDTMQVSLDALQERVTSGNAFLAEQIATLTALVEDLRADEPKLDVIADKLDVAIADANEFLAQPPA